MTRRLATYGVGALAFILSVALTAWSQGPGGPHGKGPLVFPKFAILYSAPLVNTPLLDESSTVACSVLNVGKNPATVTIRICDAGGICIVPPFGCDDVTLQPGHVCDASNIAIGTDEANYCRADAASFGQLDLRGTFQIMNGGDVSAATELRPGNAISVETEGD